MSNETRRIVTVRTVHVATYELDMVGKPVDEQAASDLFHEHIGAQVSSQECTHSIISDEPYEAYWQRIEA